MFLKLVWVPKTESLRITGEVFYRLNALLVTKKNSVKAMM